MSAAEAHARRLARVAEGGIYNDETAQAVIADAIAYLRADAKESLHEPWPVYALRSDVPGEARAALSQVPHRDDELRELAERWRERASDLRAIDFGRNDRKAAGFDTCADDLLAALGVSSADTTDQGGAWTCSRCGNHNGPYNRPCWHCGEPSTDQGGTER